MGLVAEGFQQLICTWKLWCWKPTDRGYEKIKEHLFCMVTAYSLLLNSVLFSVVSLKYIIIVHVLQYCNGMCVQTVWLSVAYFCYPRLVIKSCCQPCSTRWYINPLFLLLLPPPPPQFHFKWIDGRKSPHFSIFPQLFPFYTYLSSCFLSLWHLPVLLWFHLFWVIP
jgi:hypothetical protein